MPSVLLLYLACFKLRKQGKRSATPTLRKIIEEMASGFHVGLPSNMEKSHGQTESDVSKISQNKSKLNSSDRSEALLCNRTGKREAGLFPKHAERIYEFMLSAGQNGTRKLLLQ